SQVFGRYPSASSTTPRSACKTATTCTEASQRQNHVPASRLATQMTSPQIHPTANRATTRNPTTAWTSGTPEILRGLDRPVAEGPEPARLLLVEPPRKVQTVERELHGRGRDARALLLHAQALEKPGQARQVAELGEQLGRRHEVGGLGDEPAVQLGEHLELVVLGEVFEDVGEAVVVEGGGDLGAALGGEVVQDVRQVGRGQ